jgi:hypothetical protein
LKESGPKRKTAARQCLHIFDRWTTLMETPLKWGIQHRSVKGCVPSEDINTFKLNYDSLTPVLGLYFKKRGNNHLGLPQRWLPLSMSYERRGKTRI